MSSFWLNEKNIAHEGLYHPFFAVLDRAALGNYVSSVFVMEFEVSILFLGKFLKDKCQMSRRGLNDRPQCQGSLWLLKYKQWIEGLSTRLSHYCSTIH